jgi:molybdopterin-synthase adenylyltransferase
VPGDRRHGLWTEVPLSTARGRRYERIEGGGDLISAVLNMASYAHLVPVVDGGILIRGQRAQRLAGAEWRSYLAAPRRVCLECLGQYDPATVTVEHAGSSMTPVLPRRTRRRLPVRRNEDVFPFSAATAASETLQLCSAILAADSGDTGAHLYHFATGTLDRRINGCQPGCPCTETLTWLGGLIHEYTQVA